MKSAFIWNDEIDHETKDKHTLEVKMAEIVLLNNLTVIIILA